MMSNSAVQAHIRELYNFTVITSHRPLIVTREFCNRNPKVVWSYGYYLAPTDRRQLFETDINLFGQQFVFYT